MRHSRPRAWRAALQRPVLEVRIDRRDGEKVTVENINKAKKHQKPRQGKQAPVPGGIVDKTMPLHISKVAIWNVGAKKADRVGIKQLNDGKRVRFFKSNGEVIDA